MTQKHKATHQLTDIKAAFADPLKLNWTKVAARDSAALGMLTADVVAVIQGLRYPADFDKSATAHHDHTQWHDSYICKVGDLTLYLKFTTDVEGRLLLTSFKEA